jgi:hypothetical protein
LCAGSVYQVFVDRDKKVCLVRFRAPLHNSSFIKITI